jgi:hypothetical protein
MNATRAAALAGVLGGLVWAVAAVIGWGGDVNHVVYVVGLVWLVVALCVLGYGLVDHAPMWLRAVVSVATPALGLVVWVAVLNGFDTDHLPVLAAGIAMLAVSGVALTRSGPREVGSPVGGHRAAR